MAMTNKEFSSHFSDTFTPEIKAFGRETLLKEGFDCLIVTDKEDKEKAYCTHCKKWVKIPGDTIHTGSPKSIQAAERREYNRHCCHHGVWGMTEGDIELEKADEERRQAIKRRKYALCPECGHTFNVYHQWRMDMSQLDGTVSISIWAKSKVEPGAVVMRRIEIERNYGNGDEPVVQDTYKEAERYLFRMGKKTVRQECRPRREWVFVNKTGIWRKVKRQRRFIKSIIDRAVRQSTVMWNDYIKGHYRMNIASLKTAIRNTPYQYLFTGKRNYIRNYEHYPYRESYPLYTVNLMDLYSLRPWVELLLKNGMENIVIDHVRKIGHSGAICWGAKSIKSAVKRFTKQDMKDILAINSGQEPVTEKHLSILAEARELQMQLTVRQAIQIEKNGADKLTHMIFEARRLHLRPECVLEYCMKEGGIGYAIGDWLDYIADAGRVGLDLEDRTNSMPKNLLKRHANIIRQIKYRANRKLEEEMKETLALRNKIFSWKDKKYIIRPAASTEELIEEGKALHHCVGGYAERHAKGETTILFVRTNKAPDKPLYTMEVKGSPKSGWKMVQIRGMNNADPPEEVRMMVRIFLDEVNARGSKKKARKTA